jgi:hypothetical protein
MERIVIPLTARHPEYMLEYNQRIIRSGQNRPGHIIDVQEGFTASSAEEEMRILLESRERGQRPMDSIAYADLFGKNGYYAGQRTRTGLRVPKGWENGRCQRNARGDKEYPRILLIGNEENDDVLVPDGRGWFVAEWNDNGIPRVTVNNAILFGTDVYKIHRSNCPYFVHWWFNEKKSEVPVTLHVQFGNNSYELDFDAAFEHHLVSAFRPVRVFLTEEQKEAKRGQVSMTDDRRGQLSKAEEPGRVSLVPKATA